MRASVPILGGSLAHLYGYPVAFITLGSFSLVSIAIGPQLRGTCDMRSKELGKMTDVDSSTLLA